MTPTDDIYQRALQLPEELRADLAYVLLESLEPEVKEEGYEEAWRAEIERRIKAYDEGTATATPWREAMERIRQNLSKEKGS
jgi:putative addiction module component (TIGR02574 family)